MTTATRAVALLTGSLPPLRLVIALAVAALTGAIVYLGWRDAGPGVSDWDQAYHAARALLAGRDPYAALTPTNSPWPLQYPLPAVFLALPFSWLPLDLARPAWFGLSAGTLAYAWGTPPYYRLTALISGGFWWAMLGANWTPFLVAGLTLPAVRWWWSIKPTTGFLLWLRRPSREPVIGGLVLLGVSLLFVPTWPVTWLQGMLHPGWGYAHHPIPALLPLGWLPLMALVRWRDPDARFLAVWTLMPGSVMPSELLLTFAVARTRGEWWLLVLASWLVVAYAYTVDGSQLAGETQAIAFARWAAGIWPGVLVGWLVAVGLVLRRDAHK